MKIVDSRYDPNINSKSFINYIHPSLKIILVVLIFKIIFSLNLNSFNLNSNSSTLNIIRIIFSLIYFLFFIFIFFFLLTVINYPLGKIIKQILGFRFVFFFSLLFHSSILDQIPSKENFFSFLTWHLNPKTFYFIIIFLYVLSFFLFTKKKYKNFYFIFIFLFFFILPYFNTYLSFFSCLNKKYSYLSFDKNYFCNIFVIFLRIFLFLMVNILMKETTSFIEINDGLEIILKPLKKMKLPVEILTLMLSLIFMAIPFLLEETQKILKSQLSRGLNFYTKNIFKKIYYLISLLIPIFVLSFKKSFVLANAMETRGYVLEQKRTKFVLYKMDKNDYWILFLFLVFFTWSFL